MKKLIYIIVMIIISNIPQSSFSQTKIPDPPFQHGSTHDEPNGGGAPIGGGVLILLGLGVAYGGKKYYDFRQKINNELEE